MFTKILIANRGEIACRIIKAAKEMGMFTVAVFSEADSNSLHIHEADEAIFIGDSQPSQSYLNIDKIIAAAKQTGAEAIHPGYGFLSEKAEFAERCENEGIVFIGPSSSVIRLLGPKIQAKLEAKKAGVPVVPGYEGDVQDLARFVWEAGEIGFPILLKASAGGGGRGMRIVNNIDELPAAFEAAKREAENAFGDGKLLLEKYFPVAKHIEVQVFGDNHGNYIHLFERECSVQRRYQKIIEESPSPSLTDEQRTAICASARNLAAAVGYNNAGTVEFLLAPDGEFYFLEVNTRLQVEHPVTELVTGLDLVKLQIQIAANIEIEGLGEAISQSGFAIECRICAEDPFNNFAPSTGEISFFGTNENWNVRCDTGVAEGAKVSVYYDSMLAKFIVWGPTREDARLKMIYQLNTFPIGGLKVNTPILLNILKHEAFINGNVDTKWIENNIDELSQTLPSQDAEFLAAAIAVRGWTYDLDNAKPYDKSISGWRNSHFQDQSKTVLVNGNETTICYNCNEKGVYQIKKENEYLPILISDFNSKYCKTRLGNHFQTTPTMIVNNGDIHVWINGIGVFECSEVPRFKETVQENNGDYKCPMPGEIVKLLVAEGEKVEAGQGLIVLSSMKMESTIEAQESGTVKEIYVSEKQFVEAGKELLKVE